MPHPRIYLSSFCDIVSKKAIEKQERVYARSQITLRTELDSLYLEKVTISNFPATSTFFQKDFSNLKRVAKVPKSRSKFVVAVAD